MVIKAAQYRIQGMNRDLSESTYNADKSESPFKWAYEIMNMRIVPISEDNTEFSLVNEKGTKLIEFGSPSDAHLNYIDGNVLGTCTIGTSLILFLKYESERTLVTCPDRIGRITYNETTDKYYYTTLYQGHLNFDMKYPIETIAYYENEEIQKVYWIDGLNQPRVINICNVQYSTDKRIQWLIELGADVKAEDNDRKTVLHYAALSGSLKRIQWLIKQGLDVNAKDKNGYTVLHSAAKSGLPEPVEWLIDQGLDVNATTKDGYTVLHAAQNRRQKQEI